MSTEQQDRHIIRCGGTMRDGRACPSVLAARIAGKLFITKDGLELVVPSVDSVRCSRCGTMSSIPAVPVTPIQEIMHVGPGAR